MNVNIMLKILQITYFFLWFVRFIIKHVKIFYLSILFLERRAGGRKGYGDGQSGP
jgi:hypothetical protein